MHSLLAAALAGLFAAAALAKARDRQAFVDYLTPVFGDRVAAPAATAAVALELLLAGAFGLTLVDPGFGPAAGWSCAVFLLVATLAHAASLAVTDNASCRCFGRIGAELDRTKSHWKPALVAARNTALVFAAVTVAGVSTTSGAAAAIAIPAAIAAGILASIGYQRRLLSADTHPKAREFAPTIATLQAHSWWVNGHPRSF